MIYYLFIFLFFTGMYQVLSAFVRICTCRRLDSTYAITLKRYLVLTILYVFAWRTAMSVIGSDLFMYVTMLIIHPAIALWYWRFIRLHNQKRKRIKSFDEEVAVSNLQLLNVPCKERLELKYYKNNEVIITPLRQKIAIT